MINMKKISEESAPSERKMIYKIGLIIVVAMTTAYLFWPDPVAELPKVPLGPPDTRLLEAYALLNSTSPAGHPNICWDMNFGQERSESGHMTRSQILNLSDRMSAYADRLPAYSCCDEKDRYQRCMCEANGNPVMIQVCQETDFDSMTAKEYSMTTSCCDGLEGCQ